MSLLMYRDGALSADRRIRQANDLNDEFSGFDHHSKLYFSPDKTILMGAVGVIPSKEKFELLAKFIQTIKEPDQFVNLSEKETTVTLNKILPGDTYCIFIFYQGLFFILSKEYGTFITTQCDLSLPYLTGSGGPAGTVLIRSKKLITTKEFYRIVSSSTESVSSVFDIVEINQVKGF